jgi:primosomal protein N' (replication factor Y)
LTGIFMQTAATSDIQINKLKFINRLIDETPLLPADLLSLTQQAASYYHHPIGEVLASLLPTALRQGKPLPAIPP